MNMVCDDDVHLAVGDGSKHCLKLRPALTGERADVVVDELSDGDPTLALDKGSAIR